MRCSVRGSGRKRLCLSKQSLYNVVYQATSSRLEVEKRDAIVIAYFELAYFELAYFEIGYQGLSVSIRPVFPCWSTVSINELLYANDVPCDEFNR